MNNKWPFLGSLASAPVNPSSSISLKQNHGWWGVIPFWWMRQSSISISPPSLCWASKVAVWAQKARLCKIGTRWGQGHSREWREGWCTYLSGMPHSTDSCTVGRGTRACVVLYSQYACSLLAAHLQRKSHGYFTSKSRKQKTCQKL